MGGHTRDVVHIPHFIEIRLVSSGPQGSNVGRSQYFGCGLLRRLVGAKYRTSCD